VYDEGEKSYKHKETRRCLVLVVVVAGHAAKKGEDLAQ
jgi:hypothetical protein